MPNNTTPTPPKYDVKIHSIRPDGTQKASASVNIYGDFAVRGVKLMEGSKGLFVSMPSYKAGNGEDRDVQPVFLGGKEGCGTRTDCDIVNTSITHSSTAGTKASGTWYTFTFDKDDVKELRLYRRVKVVVNGASAVEYGNKQSVRIWGVKVWLKPTAPSITSFTVNGIEATIEGNNIFAELP